MEFPLAHDWIPAPHYTDTDWEESDSTPEMYWWCGFCEEHRFQPDKPGIEPCPAKVGLAIMGIASVCLPFIKQYEVH